MLTHSEVLGDQSALRAQLHGDGDAHRELLRLNWARPLGDIAFDWVAILAATAAVAWFGLETLPLAVLIVANRQRALGNILHDAGHRNLCRTRCVNDAVAGLLVAPLVFASLESYRADHFKHHMQLGAAGGDPDLIDPPQALPRHWLSSYLRQVFSLRAWWGNFLGHLGAVGVPWSARVGIAAWWFGALTLLVEFTGAQFTLTFVELWLLARATVFHLITTLREMCDHFGLQPGGILSFTRDVAVRGPARWLIHPRNNGYHLTHHLLPAVPYYHLPRAHALFRRLPAYRAYGTVCDAYFAGPTAVVRAWERGQIMTTRVLGTLQVAALLVSASYGIGFLFGSGEMALSHGMAGGLYGVATALGMLALATFAGRLWKLGVPVWELFGQAFGQPIQRAVALLSLVWMSGVLAAQIAGGVAIARVIGLPGYLSQALVLALILGASRLDLRVASRLFAACLLASALVLLYALADAGGLTLYAQAAPRFVSDLGGFSTSRLVSIVMAVGLLVCLGADYHQFVLAARRPLVAAAGCTLAGVILIAVAFLPPALVLALRGSGELDGLPDAKQVIPFALGRAADGLWPGSAALLLAALSTAALGSGAAIVRAMASAMAAAAPGARDTNHVGWSIAALAAGGLLAARGQGIVETMVSVNVVYLASVGWLFVLLLRGATLPAGQAGLVMGSGLAASGAVYLAGWTGWIKGDADTVSLLGGLGVSAIVGLICAIGGPRSIGVGGLRR